MRKLIVLLFFTLMFTFPAGAQAQAAIILENLKIQLWPDHDQPKVLVIYDFLLTANTSLPALMHFQMPANADLVAVAKNAEGGLLTVEHTLAPDGRSVSFMVSDKTTYHLEYYMPYQLNGTMRDFVFIWSGDYAVTSFTLVLQKPSGATALTTDPALQDIESDSNGFAYQATKSLKLAAQTTYKVHVNYQNETDTLSASTLTVQPSSSLTENVSGQVSLMNYLPWVLGLLAIILIVGGLVWYWFSSRSSVVAVPQPRSKRIRKKLAEAGEQDRQIYCHQCGKRAQPEDHFCRTCGAQLRQSE